MSDALGPYQQGGVLPAGCSVVANTTRGPEVVLAPALAVVPGCDATEPRPVYLLALNDDGVPTYGCRCATCARCGHHTGNSSQGHYWAFCSASGGLRRFHFCCPGDCELDAS